MTLQEYMNASGLDDETFGLKVGRHRTQIFRVRTGRYRPSDELKQKIAEITGGAVQPNDWFDDLPQAEEAA